MKHTAYIILSALLWLLSSYPALAESQTAEVERLMMQGDLYHLFWRTSLDAHRTWCAEILEHESKQPLALRYYAGIYAFQAGDLTAAGEHFKAGIDAAPASETLLIERLKLWSSATETPQQLPQKPEADLSDADRLQWQGERNYLQALLGETVESGDAQLVETDERFQKFHAGIYLSAGRLQDAKTLLDSINATRPEHAEVYQQVETTDGERVPVRIEFHDPMRLKQLSDYFYLTAHTASEPTANESQMLYLRVLLNLRLHSQPLAETVELLHRAEQSTTSDLQRGLIRIQLGVCDYLSQNVAAADEKWERALTVQHPTIHQTLAMAYLQLGIRPDEAIERLQHARQLFEQLPENREKAAWQLWDNSPDYRQYTWDEVWAYGVNRQYTEALRLLDEEVYLPGERHQLNERETRRAERGHDARGIKFLNLRRHLNLARVGFIYLQLTRYDDLHFYIYEKDKMLPQVYPHTRQIYDVAKQLSLYKEMTPSEVTEPVVIAPPETIKPPKRTPAEDAQSNDRRLPKPLIIGGVVLLAVVGVILFTKRQRRKNEQAR
jgi:tetratricopeptide (TPR) repeat protein